MYCNLKGQCPPFIHDVQLLLWSLSLHLKPARPCKLGRWFFLSSYVWIKTYSYTRGHRPLIYDKTLLSHHIMLHMHTRTCITRVANKQNKIHLLLGLKVRGRKKDSSVLCHNAYKGTFGWDLWRSPRLVYDDNGTPPRAPPHFLTESYKKHIENEIPALEDLANVILFCDLLVFMYAFEENKRILEKDL